MRASRLIACELAGRGDGLRRRLVLRENSVRLRPNRSHPLQRMGDGDAWMGDTVGGPLHQALRLFIHGGAPLYPASGHGVSVPVSCLSGSFRDHCSKCGGGRAHSWALPLVPSACSELYDRRRRPVLHPGVPLSMPTGTSRTQR